MRAIVVRVSVAEAELAADALWSLGVVAVEERPVADDVVELWTSLGESTAALDAVDAAFDGRWEWTTVEVDDAVVDTWRDHARPVVVDEHLVIVPAWRESVTRSWSSDALVMAIEPGPTFGLGDHPTTRLSLLALRRECDRFAGRTVLDVGCGSGVLAVAAVRFGAERAIGIDISPASVPVMLDNARRNQVADRVEVSTTPLAEVAGRFATVVANILAPTLIELADDLRRVVEPGGALVLSGLLADRYEHVVQALAPMTVSRVDEIDGWVAVTLEHGTRR